MCALTTLTFECTEKATKDNILEQQPRLNNSIIRKLDLFAGVFVPLWTTTFFKSFRETDSNLLSKVTSLKPANSASPWEPPCLWFGRLAGRWSSELVSMGLLPFFLSRLSRLSVCSFARSWDGHWESEWVSQTDRFSVICVPAVSLLSFSLFLSSFHSYATKAFACSWAVFTPSLTQSWLSSCSWCLHFISSIRDMGGSGRETWCVWVSGPP